MLNRRYVDIKNEKAVSQLRCEVLQLVISFGVGARRLYLLRDESQRAMVSAIRLCGMVTDIHECCCRGKVILGEYYRQWRRALLCNTLPRSAPTPTYIALLHHTKHVLLTLLFAKTMNRL